MRQKRSVRPRWIFRVQRSSTKESRFTRSSHGCVTALVLGRWQPHDPQYHDYVSTVAEHAGSRDDKFEALLALGALAHDKDIERLEAIASGPDDMLAAGALSGLIASNKKAAIQAVERIAADASVPDQKRRVARQMLELPRQPDDSEVR